MNAETLSGFERSYRIRVLREERRRVGEQVVHYRFCSFCFADPEYYVEIFMGEERVAVRFEGDDVTSQSIFDLLVEGTVTPCTLRDVMEDIKNSRIYSLQNGKFML